MIKKLLAAAVAAATVLTPFAASATSSGGDDTPIEPVESDFVMLYLATPEADALCAQVGEMSDLIDLFGVSLGGDSAFIFDMAAAFWQDAAESGVGKSAAMTLEAETLFRAWVYDCGGRVDTSVVPLGFAAARPHPQGGTFCYSSLGSNWYSAACVESGNLIGYYVYTQAWITCTNSQRFVTYYGPITVSRWGAIKSSKATCPLGYAKWDWSYFTWRKAPSNFAQQITGFAAAESTSTFKPAPESLTSCWVTPYKYAKPGYAKAGCGTSGYGWVQLEIVCTLFDNGPFVVGSTPWVYKQPGSSWSAKATCPSTKPVLVRAYLDTTK